ncbi:luciferase [Streptomonospora alba]|uniref:Luciferase n=1 Tax=Streptomonospora alba TaxID=183763 RepID=A0A0C2G574_9ACTN|nr:LLM class F420-dependent oxidoreductase [Streptomonospora alba]KIH98418.1 luciferase [Streptomonospora alba]
MRIGIQIPRFTSAGSPEHIGPAFARTAREADQAGLSSLWVMDHLWQIEMVGAVEEPMLEGYSALSYAAGVTENITLGTLVTGAVYRHPGMLVKSVTTLDVLSGGRAWLGIGAAWFEGEALGLGLPFPPTAERFERLEETLQIAQRMWSDDESPYHGRHYRLERPLNSPASVQRPHPPILIGGGGEKKTLRYVAKYGDACNLFAGPDLEHKLGVLREHCAAEGRDYAEIEKTSLAMVGPDSSVDQVVDECGRLAELGIDHAICTGYTDAEGAAAFLGRVAEQAAAITPAGR